MNIFYIASHYFDKDFEKKFQLTEEIAQRHGAKLFKAVKNGLDNFDAIHSAAIYEQADCFIADLSYERPSCYYEIGNAHGLGKEVKLIAKEGTFIHQVKGEVSFYSTFDEYKILISEIVEVLIKSYRI